MDILAQFLHSIQPLLDPIIHILVNPHVQMILSGLYIFTLASKFIPALRVLGLLSQAAALVLEMARHYALTHPTGQKIAAVATVEQKLQRNPNLPPEGI